MISIVKKIFLSYCKQILVVNKYTTNDAVRGELRNIPTMSVCNMPVCKVSGALNNS